MGNKYKQLNREERDKVYRFLGSGKGIGEIGKAI